MSKILLVVATLACGIAFGYTPTAHTNVITRGGVTYAQRGGLGNSDYVVTNVSMSASDVNALPSDSVSGLTGNTNFTTAVAQVSPPTDVSYKADAEVKQTAYEYRFLNVESGSSKFDIYIGLREAVEVNFSGNHLLYVRVKKNGVEWVNPYISPLSNWCKASDNDSDDYVEAQKNANGWTLRVSSPYSYLTGKTADHSIVITYKSVAESIANLVPNTRKVNNQPLTGDVSITASGLGAVEKRPDASETKLYGNEYTFTEDSQTGNVREISVFHDRMWLKDKNGSTNNYLVIRNWRRLSEGTNAGAGFDISDANGNATFLLPDKTSNAGNVYHLTTAEDVSSGYNTKREVDTKVANGVSAGLENYKGQYVWKSTEDKRMAWDGSLYYKKWSGSSSVAWTNKTSGAYFTYSSANTWTGNTTQFGNVTLKYDDSTGTYYINEYQIIRYSETLVREASINLMMLGDFEAVQGNPYGSNPISWVQYGVMLPSTVFGNEENAKGSSDWWFRQGVKWDIDDRELLWDGSKWTATEDGNEYSVLFKTQPSDNSDKVVYTYRTIVSGVTNTTDSASVDYREFGTYGDYIMFGSEYAYRLRIRNHNPKDYSVPDWARSATPPSGMDYQAMTNTINAVKAQFYDEPLQVNWTLKMVNGEMKLYATTNVNMSTL